MSRELDTLKRQFDNLVTEKDRVMLANRSRHDAEEWSAVYYAHPYPAQVPFLERKVAALRSVDPVLADALEPILTSMRVLAAEIATLKSVPRLIKAPSVRLYNYPVTPEAVIHPNAIQVGHFLLVRYGAGTQLVRVIETSFKRIRIDRLVNRGTPYAVWRKSGWLARTDSRILGLSSPVAADPKI